eukprot:366458-Chlamydomonas_euryale.AAC.1
MELQAELSAPRSREAAFSSSGVLPRAGVAAGAALYAACGAALMPWLSRLSVLDAPTVAGLRAARWVWVWGAGVWQVWSAGVRQLWVSWLSLLDAFMAVGLHAEWWTHPVGCGGAATTCHAGRASAARDATEVPQT